MTLSNAIPWIKIAVCVLCVLLKLLSWHQDARARTCLITVSYLASDYSVVNKLDDAVQALSGRIVVCEQVLQDKVEHTALSEPGTQYLFGGCYSSHTYHLGSITQDLGYQLVAHNDVEYWAVVNEQHFHMFLCSGWMSGVESEGNGIACWSGEQWTGRAFDPFLNEV